MSMLAFEISRHLKQFVVADRRTNAPA